MALGSFFSRLKEGLSRSTQKLSGGITAVFKKRRLDDEASRGQPADEPVAAWEIARERGHAQRKFRYQRAILREPVGKVAIARRIDDVEPGAHHCDG